MSRLSRPRVLVFLLSAVMAAGALPAAAEPSSSAALSITTVANPRPALLSGSETLLRVSHTVPGLRVLRDGRDITAVFTPQPDGSLLGLATGLTPGRHVVTATARGVRASLPPSPPRPSTRSTTTAPCSPPKWR